MNTPLQMSPVAPRPGDKIETTMPLYQAEQRVAEMKLRPRWHQQTRKVRGEACEVCGIPIARLKTGRDQDQFRKIRFCSPTCRKQRKRAK